MEGGNTKERYLDGKQGRWEIRNPSPKKKEKEKEKRREQNVQQEATNEQVRLNL